MEMTEAGGYNLHCLISEKMVEEEKQKQQQDDCKEFLLSKDNDYESVIKITDNENAAKSTQVQTQNPTQEFSNVNGLPEDSVNINNFQNSQINVADENNNSNCLYDHAGVEKTKEEKKTLGNVQPNQTNTLEQYNLNNIENSLQSNKINLTSDSEENTRCKGKIFTKKIKNKILEILAKYKIAHSKKYREDGFRKKIKVHFLSWLIQRLNSELFKCLRNKQFKFIKINQKNVSTIKIESTREFLMKSVQQLFEEDTSGTTQENNKTLMEKLMEKCDSNVKIFLSKTLKEVYEEFLSNGLEANIKKLKRLYNSHYVDIYKFLAKYFVVYFMNCVPNQKRNSDRSNENSQTNNTFLQTAENEVNNILGQFDLERLQELEELNRFH